MLNFSEFFQKLSETKSFICIIYFIFYSLGLYAFYSNNEFKIATVFTFLFLIFTSLIFLNKTVQKFVSPAFIFSLYLLFPIGFLNASIHSTSVDDFSNISYMKNVEIQGLVLAIPKITTSNNTYKFPLKVKTAIINSVEYEIENTKILVVIKNPNNEIKEKLKYGNELLLKGSISTPATATNPSQFDYNKFLKHKGILKIFYADEDSIKYLKSSQISDIKDVKNKISFLNICLTKYMYQLRDGIIEKHSKYIKSPKLEILGGIVFGDDAVNPSDEVKDSFINSGLLHLLAASGLNVVLILSIWFCVIHFLNIPYQLKIISGIFIVFLYTLMTGFPPSIVRASVMLFLVLIGKLLYREANGISLIFAAGFIILIFKPEFIVDVGFQLSFLVALGLIICIPSINYHILPFDKKFIGKIKYYPKIIKSFLLIFSPTSILCCILIPFIAQLWAAPLQAYYFNTFSTYSILANIMVVPFIGIVSFLGFISTAFCFIPYISDLILPVFDFILNFIIQIILNISNFFSNLPYSTPRVPSGKPILIGTFYILVILFFSCIKYSFKKKILNISFSVVFFIFLIQFIKIPSNNLEIIFFNVGNADNCLIKTPLNKYIMIDTGRTTYTGLSTAKTITLEYLYDMNIKEIDTLIVTHYDSDHSGGLLDILNEIKVKNLIIQKPVCASKISCNIKDYIKENNIKYQEPYNGQNFNIDGIELINFTPKSGIENEASTVSIIKTNEHKFLFMADTGLIGYKTIENKLPDNIDILKTAHHGAKDTVNSSMLEKLKPKYSIISTGKNPYGHPNIETINLLKKYSKTLSTKDLGAIKFVISIDKNDIKVYNFDSNKRKFLRISF